MDLLDRYLHAIKPLLPRKLQEDILRELSDEILSQIEEKETALGRPLTEAEQEEIIKRYGHPVVVAARYGRAHYLIGPGVFPFYWLILRIAAVGALIVRWIIAMVTIASSPHPNAAIVPEIIAVPGVLIPVFAWVTGTFAVCELCLSRLDITLKRGWSPRSLPAVSKGPADISRPSSVAEIVFGSLFIAWWQGSGPAAGGVLWLAPIWSTLHWPILALAAAGVLQSAVNLVRPQLTPVRVAFRLALQIFAFVLLCLLLEAGNWAVVAHARDASVSQIVNQVFFYCIVSAIVITVVQFALECRKYGRRLLWRSATGSPALRLL